ncbi:MAG TPA: LysE family translocator [Rhodobacteraceae bacterium]|nr:LysE family translocator [Paracoccaceae bacterium]
MSSLFTLLPEWPAFSTFLLASLAVGASPGPGMMFAVARSLEQGRAAGAVSVLGLSAGSLTWCFAGAFGVAALIAASPLAFSALRYFGAAYLVYLAGRTLLSQNQPLAEAGQKKRKDPAMRLFTQAFATNLMNPKSVLFYLAFVPQFTDPERGSVIAQFLLLGIIFNITGNSINMMVALFFGHIGEWLNAHPSVWRVQKWFTATVFCGIAAHLVFAPRN